MVNELTRSTPRSVALLVVTLLLVTLFAVSIAPSVAQDGAGTTRSDNSDNAAAASAATTRELTIAAYNVENMFDVFDNPYTADEGTDIKLHFQVKQLAAMIRKLDADVVGLAEIENEFLLKQMVSEFLPDMGYRNIVVQKTNDQRGINLGVISRLPILRTSSYRTRRLSLPDDNREWFFARDLMQVTLDIGEGEQRPLELFVVHFKSKRDSDGDPQSASWRLAEATETRRVISRIIERDKDALVALVGDLNDTSETPPITTLTHDDLLTSAHADLPEEQRITYLHEPYKSQIDYILTSPALHATLKSASVPTSDNMIDGSDHAPVVATFELE